MKKILIGVTAAIALACAPLTSASALDLTVGADTWSVQEDWFGISDVREDAYDESDLALSIDGGATFEGYSCRVDSLVTETVLGSGKIATCNELVTVVEGLNVRGFAYVYPDSLKAAVTYKITNTTGSAIPFKWEQYHNYGQGIISGATYSSVFSKGDGADQGTTPASVAWGPTTQDCSAASDDNDAYDNMVVTSESCSIAAGASIGLTFFHMIDDNDSNSDLQTAATGLFVTRNADSTLAAGIPSGLVSANWGITGTLDVSTVPAATDPFDPSESMTLTGDAILGSYMTIAFKDVAGNDPVGTYFDIWMCPNKDVKPVDEAEVGDCIPTTFWDRGMVASYNQNTTALTMTWLLANEDVPGLIAEGGASYLDGDGLAINIDKPEGDKGWCEYEGWYIIVNDFNGGAHSNWSPALGAAGCSEPAAPATLANTGLDLQTTGLIGLFALIGGLAVVVIRRRAAQSL